MRDIEIMLMAQRVGMFNALADLGNALESAGMQDVADAARSKALKQLDAAARAPDGVEGKGEG